MTLTDEELYQLGVKARSKLKPKEFFGNTVANHAIAWSDGKIHTTNRHECHGFFYNINRCREEPLPPNPIVIAHRVFPYDEKYGNFFYHYLFNESPWADVFVTKDVSKIQDDGITVRLDRPATLTLSGAIATRHPWEKAGLVETFYHLVNAGLDKDMAMVAACCVYWDGINEDFFSKYTSHHVCLYAYDMTKAGLMNFFNRHLPPRNDYNTKTYQELMAYNDIIGMWNAVREGKKVHGVLKGKFGDSTEVTQIKDPFSVLVKIAKQKPKPVVKQIEDIFKEVLA